MQKKVMWLEEDASLFYWTSGKVQCPYAPDFETKCEIKQISLIRRNLPFFRFWGLEGDAIISIRNWESHMAYKIPPNLIQIMQILEPPSIARDANIGLNNAWLSSYQR